MCAFVAFVDGVVSVLLMLSFDLAVVAVFVCACCADASCRSVLLCCVVLCCLFCFVSLVFALPSPSCHVTFFLCLLCEQGPSC